jgi:3-oxoacyl-[acyl-carrier-protein] synthase II
MTGHLLGARRAGSGADDSGVARPDCSPTTNLDHQDDDNRLNLVPNTPQRLEIRHAMTNSFGFGGNERQPHLRNRSHPTRDRRPRLARAVADLVTSPM